MMPVEHGRTCIGSHPTCIAVSEHIRRASRSPCAPVQALALPEFTTTPRNLPFDAAMCSRPIFTGAAKTLFVVNTAAVVAGIGASQISKPTSFFLVDLIPA